MLTEAKSDRYLSAHITPWVLLNRTLQVAKKGTVASVELTLRMRMQHRPYQLKISCSTDQGKILSAYSPCALGTTDRTLSVQWCAFQDSSITLRISFAVAIRDSLRVRSILSPFLLKKHNRSSSRPGVHRLSLADRSSHAMQLSDFSRRQT